MTVNGRLDPYFRELLDALRNALDVTTDLTVEVELFERALRQIADVCESEPDAVAAATEAADIARNVLAVSAGIQS